MGDALQRVLQGVGEVVHGIDAPLIPLAVVVHVVDAVNHRVPHIKIPAGQVDFGPQSIRAVGELPGPHPGEEVQGFFHRPVPPGGAGGGAHVPAVGAKFLGTQRAHIGQPLLNQSHGILVHLLKIVGGKVKPVPPVVAQPVDVLLNGLHVLHVLLGGVGVVHAQVAQAAVLLGGAEVHKNGLGVANVQVAVGLRRKAGVDRHTLELAPLSDVLVDKVMDEILCHNRGQIFWHIPSLLIISIQFSIVTPTKEKCKGGVSQLATTGHSRVLDARYGKKTKNCGDNPAEPVDRGRYIQYNIRNKWRHRAVPPAGGRRAPLRIDSMQNTGSRWTCIIVS